MIVHQGAEQFLGMVLCQLLHLGHCEAEPPKNEQSTRGFHIGVRDVMQRMNRIEKDGTEGLEV